ncbi:MAG: Asp23/Gls24 family envelope stress response protein [Candidatus Dormibacteria bacterium]
MTSIPGPGSVRVADEVIASIAATAAREVEGVAGVDPGAGRQLGRVLHARNLHQGVRVELVDSDTLTLEMYIAVNDGCNIPEAAARVQTRVAEAIDKMLSLAVAHVDVVVSDVVFARPGG